MMVSRHNPRQGSGDHQAGVVPGLPEEAAGASATFEEDTLQVNERITAMVWRYNRKIAYLYADWESRNSYAWVLEPASGELTLMQFNSTNFDTVTNMTVVAAEAKSDDRWVWIGEQPLGVISAIYVW
jgi:hypothetical protein